MHAVCEDYRAGATIDRRLDEADLPPAARSPVRPWCLGQHYLAGRPARCLARLVQQLAGAAVNSGHFLAEENPRATLAALHPVPNAFDDGRDRRCAPEPMNHRQSPAGRARPPAAVRPTIALALGGGGARGLAHILMLEVFDELGLKPKIIAGTSIGALFGAAYASGLSARLIRAHAEEVLSQRFDLARHLLAARAEPVTSSSISCRCARRC